MKRRPLPKILGERWEQKPLSDQEINDLISALINLGIKKKEATDKVNNIVRDFPGLTFKPVLIKLLRGLNKNG